MQVFRWRRRIIFPWKREVARKTSEKIRNNFFLLNILDIKKLVWNKAKIVTGISFFLIIFFGSPALEPVLVQSLDLVGEFQVKTRAKTLSLAETTAFHSHTHYLSHNHTCTHSLSLSRKHIHYFSHTITLSLPQTHTISLKHI